MGRLLCVTKHKISKFKASPNLAMLNQVKSSLCSNSSLQNASLEPKMQNLLSLVLALNALLTFS